MAGVSSGLPALLEGYKLSSRAARVGFDWPDISGLFEKLEEEAQELKKDLEQFPAPGPHPQGRGIAGSGAAQIPESLRHRMEDEIGDLFFVVVNLARYLSVDSELALKKTNRKFRRRFQYVEEQLRAQGRKLEEASLEEMESLGYLNIVPTRNTSPLFPKVYYVTGKGVRKLRDAYAAQGKTWEASRIDRKGVLNSRSCRLAWPCRKRSGNSKMLTWFHCVCSSSL